RRGRERRGSVQSLPKGHAVHQPPPGLLRQRRPLRLPVRRRDPGRGGRGRDHARTPRAAGRQRLRKARARRLKRAEGLDESAVELAAREVARERLGQRAFDLLVIGGGIVGAGIAAAAARARLAGARGNGLAAAERARDHVPSLRLDGLRSCGLYADAATHDSRLCLASVRAAAEAGATVLNYAEVRELRTVSGRVAGAEVLVDGTEVSVSARMVVNATGPRVDEVRLLEDPSATPSVRLSKGAHVLLRLDERWAAALTIPHDKV